MKQNLQGLPEATLETILLWYVLNSNENCVERYTELTLEILLSSQDTEYYIMLYVQENLHYNECEEIHMGV